MRILVHKIKAYCNLSCIIQIWVILMIFKGNGSFYDIEIHARMSSCIQNEERKWSQVHKKQIFRKNKYRQTPLTRPPMVAEFLVTLRV